MVIAAAVITHKQLVREDGSDGRGVNHVRPVVVHACEGNFEQSSHWAVSRRRSDSKTGPPWTFSSRAKKS